MPNPLSLPGKEIHDPIVTQEDLKDLKITIEKRGDKYEMEIFIAEVLAEYSDKAVMMNTTKHRTLQGVVMIPLVDFFQQEMQSGKIGMPREGWGSGENAHGEEVVNVTLTCDLNMTEEEHKDLQKKIEEVTTEIKAMDRDTINYYTMQTLLYAGSFSEEDKGYILQLREEITKASDSYSADSNPNYWNLFETMETEGAIIQDVIRRLGEFGDLKEEVLAKGSKKDGQKEWEAFVQDYNTALMHIRNRTTSPAR
jgi:hypothetical protein